MTTFEALGPLTIRTKTFGVVTLQPGDQQTWPDEAVQALLAACPNGVRVIPNAPFHIGQKVSYRVPRGEFPLKWAWRSFPGTVLSIHARMETVTVQPDDDRLPITMVPYLSVQPLKAQEDHSHE